MLAWELTDKWHCYRRTKAGKCVGENEARGGLLYVFFGFSAQLLANILRGKLQTFSGAGFIPP